MDWGECGGKQRTRTRDCPDQKERAASSGHRPVELLICGLWVRFPPGSPAFALAQKRLGESFGWLRQVSVAPKRRLSAVALAKADRWRRPGSFCVAISGPACKKLRSTRITPHESSDFLHRACGRRPCTHHGYGSTERLCLPTQKQPSSRSLLHRIRKRRRRAADCPQCRPISSYRNRPSLETHRLDRFCGRGEGRGLRAIPEVRFRKGIRNAALPVTAMPHMRNVSRIHRLPIGAGRARTASGSGMLRALLRPAAVVGCRDPFVAVCDYS